MGNDVIERIENKIDLAKAGGVAVSNEIGGVQFQTVLELMEFAKLMAVSDIAVPPHLRGKPGACLAVLTQALEWRMSPFAVANKSYSVVNKGVERIAYESQLINAVIEARAPLKGRLRHEIIGDGDERRCRVWGTFKGEDQPHEYISETLGRLRDARGRNDYGQVKGSPLWDSQPEVQLAYSARRQWARLFAPDVLMGLYSEDELRDESEVKDVTPKNAVAGLADRLKGSGKGKRGFNAEHVESEVANAKGEPATTIEASAETPAQERQAEAPADQPEPHAISEESPADPIADAFAAGAAAKAAGKTKRAMPGAYREEGREAEHAAWLNGFGAEAATDAQQQN
jgi:hypothetical protein